MGDLGHREIEALVAARGPALMQEARLLVRDPHDAEDLLQDALARLIPRWRSISGDPEGYLRRIMVNLAIDRGRRKVRRPEILGAVPEVSSGDPARAVTERDALVEALRGLPPRQRIAVVLRTYVDLDERTTAEMMRCSVGTVKSLTAKGLATLRDRSAHAATTEQW